MLIRLLHYLTDTNHDIVVSRLQRIQIFVNIFMGGPVVEGAYSEDAPQKPLPSGPLLSVLVRRLNEVFFNNNN